MVPVTSASPKREDAAITFLAESSWSLRSSASDQVAMARKGAKCASNVKQSVKPNTHTHRALVNSASGVKQKKTNFSDRRSDVCKNCTCSWKFSYSFLQTTLSSWLKPSAAKVNTDCCLPWLKQAKTPPFKHDFIHAGERKHKSETQADLRSKDPYARLWPRPRFHELAFYCSMLCWNRRSQTKWRALHKSTDHTCAPVSLQTLLLLTQISRSCQLACHLSLSLRPCKVWHLLRTTSQG